jgi:ribosomal protein L37AE/L43A
MDIIQTISQQASSLSESDLSWILPELHIKYLPVIRNFSIAAKQSDRLAQSAFEANAKQSISQAVTTFLFKKKHWQNNINLHHYLIKTLSNLKSEKLIENSTNELVNKPVCPLCKTDKHKEFLSVKNGLYHCKRCSEVCDNFTSANSRQSSNKIELRKIFSNHSKKGVRCPDCKKWIPDSAFDNGIFPCPYTCGFIGFKSEYCPGSHPVALTSRDIKSLNDKISSDNDSSLEKFLSSSSITEQEEFILSQDLEQQFFLIKDTLIQQQKSLHNTATTATIVQKELMYQAFINLLDKLPYEMTMYLGHQKNVSKYPLQCQIFQEYADLMLNYLPFNIVKGKNSYEITDPCDPKLSLFLGISTYSSIVKDNGIIPNETLENYIGGKQIKDYGPCFIGKLISVSSHGEDILDSVDHYTFNEIKTNLSAGTPVQVKHFRIASHYEMHSLVFLQRIRRAVVDKVYFIINKEKRKIKS